MLNIFFIFDLNKKRYKLRIAAQILVYLRNFISQINELAVSLTKYDEPNNLISYLN
jgi:hypothetical protein